MDGWMERRSKGRCTAPVVVPAEVAGDVSRNTEDPDANARRDSVSHRVDGLVSLQIRR